MKTYNKLVRDKIPEIITANGEKANTRILSEEEYKLELRKKLVEEAKEYLEDGSVEELADVMEVIYALMKADPYLESMVEIERAKKNVKRGAFDKKIFLISTEKEKT